MRQLMSKFVPILIAQTINSAPILQQPKYSGPPVMQGTVPTSLPVQAQYPPQPGTIIVGASFGRDPTTMHCPHCKIHLCDLCISA